MYDLDREKWDAKLQYADKLVRAAQSLPQYWSEEQLVYGLAQARLLQVVIEWVTDIGTMMIDTLMMRDPGDYLDIIDILHGEGVMAEPIAQWLRELVALRRALQQEYESWPMTRHAKMDELADMVIAFRQAASEYMENELF